MTSLSEQLKQDPQINVDIGSLPLAVRSQLRTIDVQNYRNAEIDGKFQKIYYLEGDEEAAVTLFIEKHRELLEQIDWSMRNVVKSNVDQTIYVQILHELGERKLSKTPTTVREDRQNGEIWLIEREWFEKNPEQRYSVTGGDKVAKLSGTTPRKILEKIDGDIITSSAVEEYIEGDGRRFLEYLRSSEEFSCVPITHDSEMAVKLVPEQPTEAGEKSGTE